MTISLEKEGNALCFKATPILRQVNKSCFSGATIQHLNWPDVQTHRLPQSSFKFF